MSSRTSVFKNKWIGGEVGLEDDNGLVIDPPVIIEFEPAVTVGSKAVQLAERSVVGAILADNSIFDTVCDIVCAADFDSVIMSAVFTGISDVIEGKFEGIDVADAISIASLPSVCQLVSVEVLLELARSSNLISAISHAKVLARAAGERNLHKAIAKAQAISNGAESLQDRSDEIQRLLTGATEVRSLPIKSIGAAAVEALTEMAERAALGASNMGMTTGFFDLDALLAGLHGGQLIVVAARPGIGKTAFAMSLGLATASAGNCVLMASMEMKAKELSKRALAIVSGVDGHAIRIGALTEADWDAVVGAGEELADLPFNIVDLPSVTLVALSALARRLHREGKLHLIIVDYLQIMETSGGKNGSREQEVAALSRGLKKLAMQLNVPVIVLSQLNRSIESRTDRRPQLSDLRESGAIEQDADVIMFVHREGGEDQAEQDAEIIVGKQREGPVGVVEMTYSKKSTQFRGRHQPAHSRTLTKLRHAA